MKIDEMCSETGHIAASMMFNHVRSTYAAYVLDQCPRRWESTLVELAQYSTTRVYVGPSRPLWKKVKLAIRDGSLCYTGSNYTKGRESCSLAGAVDRWRSVGEAAC